VQVEVCPSRPREAAAPTPIYVNTTATVAREIDVSFTGDGGAVM
jgi:hypothetical protein